MWPGSHFAPDLRLLGQQFMKDETKLTPLQRLRTRAHLLLTALRKRLTLGVRAVLLDGKKVLLVKHTYTPGWQFPGGGVEPGETAETAAGREALEETGYAVDGRPVLHGLFLNRIAGGKRDHVAVYVWRDFRSQLEFAPNLEIAECSWRDLRQDEARFRVVTTRRGIVTEWPSERRATASFWGSCHNHEALTARS